MDGEIPDRVGTPSFGMRLIPVAQRPSSPHYFLNLLSRRSRAYYHYMLTLFSNRSSRHTIQKPSRLWVFAVKNRAAPRRARILASFRKTEESVRVIEGLRRYEFWLSSSSGDECVSGGDDTPRKPRRRGKPKGVPPEGWVGSAPSALLPSLDVSSSRTRSRLDASHPRHFRPIAELL